MSGIADIITPDYVAGVYMMGADLTDDNGVPFADLMYQSAIDGSIRLWENELGISLGGLDSFTERLDAVDWDSVSWNLKGLAVRPVRSVESYGFRYGNFEPATIPLSWATVVSELAGQVQIMPSPEAFSVAVGGVSLGAFLNQSRIYTPGWYQVTYTAGWYGGATLPVDVTEYEPDTPMRGRITLQINRAGGEDSTFIVEGTDEAGAVVTHVNDLGATVPGELVTIATGQARKKTRIRFATVTKITAAVTAEPLAAGTADVPAPYLWLVSSEHSRQREWGVPPDLINLVAYTAAALPLDIAGDLIAGAGIASFSTGVDGISTSVSTTSSATNAGYGAKLISYKARAKMLAQAARGRYRRREIVVF